MEPGCRVWRVISGFQIENLQIKNKFQKSRGTILEYKHYVFK